MILDHLELTHFRNYDHLDLQFHPNMNIFIGKNGMGKTNILESIYALAITKSHRCLEENTMIQEQFDFFRICGVFKSEKILKDHYDYIYFKNKKNVKKNGNEIKKLSSYLSNINVVLFSPESIELIKGTPSYRRKFLNIEIGQLNSNYLKIVNEYNHYLKIRNDLLKRMQRQESVDEIYFHIVTDKLISRAIMIYQERYTFLENINEQITKIFKQLTRIDNLRVHYEPNIVIEDFSLIEKKMLDKFEKNRKKEVQLGSTLYGPHRDDFSFLIDNKNMLELGSQGQQRLIALSFKLSEIKLFKKYTGHAPLILLDDVFSELDKMKKNSILNKIPTDAQIFITTNDLANIQKQYLRNAWIFEVKDGQVKKRRGGKYES